MIYNVEFVMLLLALGAIAADQREPPQHKSSQGLIPTRKRSDQHNRNKIMKKASQYENLPQLLPESENPLQPNRQNKQSGNNTKSKCQMRIQKLTSHIRQIERNFMAEAEAEAKVMLLTLKKGYPTLVEEVIMKYGTNLEALAHFMEIYEAEHPEPEIDEEEDWTEHMAKEFIKQIKEWHVDLVNEIVDTTHSFEDALAELLSHLHDQQSTKHS